MAHSAALAKVQSTVYGVVAYYFVVVSDLLEVRMSLCKLLVLREPHALVRLAIKIKMTVDVGKTIKLITVQVYFCDGIVRNVRHKKKSTKR
jgi:hypothetical protein